MPINDLFIIFKVSVYVCLACCVADIIYLIVEAIHHITGHHKTEDGEDFHWRDH